MRAFLLAAPLGLFVVAACGGSDSAAPSALPDGGTDAATEASVDAGDDADAAPPPPTPGGTGAFGIVTVGGRQKLYLPQDTTNTDGHAVISVVDVGALGNGVTGAPALITDIDLGVADLATTTGGDATTVVAASISSHKVWFIDPATDTLKKTIDLDSGYGASGFSGGGGVVTGIAIDSAHHRAILSVWNGFALLDLATFAVTSTILAPPSENFGFDAAHQRIIAPFYMCNMSSNGSGPPAFCTQYKAPDQTLMTDGLNVIDLVDGTVYTFQNPQAADPHMPVGSEPDSASADPSTGAIVVPSEGGGFQNVIDLSQATFDKPTKTVTAPWRKVDALLFEGVAVESTSHLAFFEAEGNASVAVGDVAAMNAGSARFARGAMPNKPDATTWANLGDPHGVAVTASLRDRSAVGVTVDAGRKWVARIDLAKMIASAPDASSVDLSAAQVASSVTYLDARTKL